MDNSYTEIFDSLNNGIILKLSKDKFFLNQNAEQFTGIIPGYKKDFDLESFWKHNNKLHKILNDPLNYGRSFVFKQFKVSLGENKEIIIDFDITQDIGAYWRWHDVQYNFENLELKKGDLIENFL